MFKGQGEAIEVDVRRLPDILEQSDVPHDFDSMSIDIEGLDFDVFNDLIETSPYRPRCVIIEAPYLPIPLSELGVSSAVLNSYRQVGATIANHVLQLI